MQSQHLYLVNITEAIGMIFELFHGNLRQLEINYIKIHVALLRVTKDLSRGKIGFLAHVDCVDCTMPSR